MNRISIKKSLILISSKSAAKIGLIYLKTNSGKKKLILNKITLWIL